MEIYTDEHGNDVTIDDNGLVIVDTPDGHMYIYEPDSGAIVEVVDENE
jgi:hypothetical protein